MKPEDIMKALGCCLLSNEHQCEECEKCPLDECPKTICQNLLAYHTLAILREKDAEIERLNKEVDRLSQVVLYHDAQMVDTIKEFAERACNGLQTGNIIMDKSIHDIIDRIENEMLEELK
jgi:hypothetical protein